MNEWVNVSVILYFCLFKKPDIFFFKFIFERERERVCARVGEGPRERGRERIPSRLWAVSAEPDAGLKLTNREIMTRADIRSQILHQLSYPGTPLMCSFKNVTEGCLGGPVSRASDFGSGHDLTVREFEPHVRLTAVSTEPASHPLSPSLSSPSLLTLSLFQK